MTKDYNKDKEIINMSSKYGPEFKHKIVKLHLEEERSLRSIATEYGISKASITNWCNEFNEECEAQSKNDPDTKTEADYMKENRRLRQELEEAKKENLFLKKAAAFFAKEIG